MARNAYSREAHWAVGLAAGFDSNEFEYESDIEWPTALVKASLEAERQVKNVICREPMYLRRRGRDLPLDKKRDIVSVAAANGMSEYQVLSLRRHIIYSMKGPKHMTNFLGQASGQQENANIFESACEAFLIDQGVSFIRHNKIRETYNSNQAPDLVFDTPTRINGRIVGWLDAKNFYGNALFASNNRMTRTSPTGKLLETDQRYKAIFGPGAFLLRHGYCSHLETILPNTMLLDGTPLDLTASVIHQSRGRS